MPQNGKFDYDYIVIGSGFGGAVSALRLSEKGYKVLVLEKGKRLTAKDFPKTNWNFKKWLWLPMLRFFGLFKLTYFRHVAVLSGVGVGGGSLVYANTLPVPKSKFFQAKSWAHLTDWETELAPFYQTALKMMGAVPNPCLQIGDRALLQLAKEIGKEAHFEPTNVAIYFGEQNVPAPDPYFDGKGPSRKGCNFCGGCMLGCRYNAKNTLDKNYLYFAEQNGVKIHAESEVYDVAPLAAPDGSQGYRVKWKSSTSFLKSSFSRSNGLRWNAIFDAPRRVVARISSVLKPKISDRRTQERPGLYSHAERGNEISSEPDPESFRRGKFGEYTCSGVVFAGGVLGTIKLLLKLQQTSLPNLSEKLGSGVRTNSESLIGVTSFDKSKVFSEGVAIGSILHTDEHSHLEPVRYSAGSGAWRLLMSPLAHGGTALIRFGKVLFDFVKRPLANLKTCLVDDWSKRTQILLYMRTFDSTLRFSRGLFRMKSSLEDGPAPAAFMPEAKDLAERYAKIIDGKATVLATETLFGIPTTAHILGGAVMGRDREEGVIDKDNRVFGYENMYVCDGSMISANPGVNPSLTIMALTERAMNKVQSKKN